MEWKFRKDFQVMPGVRLTYGNNGIQTFVRSQGNDKRDVTFEAAKLKHQLFKSYEAQHEIKSASIDKLTSPDLKDFKMILLKSEEVYAETKQLLETKSGQQKAHSSKLHRLKTSLFKFLFKKKIARMEEELLVINEEVTELTTQLQYSTISLEIDTEEGFSELYKKIRSAFSILNQSNKKWDFTSTKSTNRVAERTSASSTITRSEIGLSEKTLPIIICEETGLCFHNINGGDLYLYPGFIVVYESGRDFAIINYTELEVAFNQTRFIESEKVPQDSNVVGHTWYKVNKDGSPDKRFTSNYKIPIVNYGELHFTSRSGLNEVYCFSNVEFALLFHKALTDYLDVLKKSQSLLDSFVK